MLVELRFYFHIFIIFIQRNINNFRIPILNEDFSDLSDGKIKSTLVCLNVARKYGYLDLKISTDKMWKDVVPFDLLHIAILHQNAEVNKFFDDFSTKF